MDEPLLARWAPRTKLIRPVASPDVVLDPALVARVEDFAASVPLTLIVAAAGSGGADPAGLGR